MAKRIFRKFDGSRVIKPIDRRVARLQGTEARAVLHDTQAAHIRAGGG